MKIVELVNKKSQVLRKIGIDLDSLDENEIITLMQENPRIIIRPLLTDGRGLLLRFKEEQYRNCFFE